VRILLVNLPDDPRETMFPLELAGAGAVLKAAGHEVDGFDFGTQRTSAWPATAASHDVIVWMPGLATWPRVAALLGELARDDRRLVVLGGPYATLFPQEVLREPAVDVVVLGEAEEVLGHVVRLWSERTPDAVAGVVWHDRWRERGFRSNENRRRIERLDDIPPPDRTVFSIDNYRGMVTRRTRYTQIVTGRGSSRDCRFSPRSRLLPGGRRARSVRHVVEEMCVLREQHGIKEFHFEDQGLFEDRDYTVELCRAVRRELPGVVWQCPAGNHPDDLHADTLPDLAKAGCYRIYLEPHGIHESNMRLLGWSWDPGRIETLAAEARSVGMELGGYFTLGLPDELQQEMLDTVRFAVESGLAWAQFTPFRFTPGSQLHDQIEHLLPRCPAAATIRRIVRRAYWKFYGSKGRWRIVLRGLNHRNAPLLLWRAYDKMVRGQPI